MRAIAHGIFKNTRQNEKKLVGLQAKIVEKKERDKEEKLRPEC